MNWKKTWEKFKKTQKQKAKKRKQLKKIQSKSYFEAMKKQSEIMGRRQAEIEAKEREKAFKQKFLPKKQQPKRYNWVTGKYE